MHHWKSSCGLWAPEIPKLRVAPRQARLKSWGQERVRRLIQRTGTTY
jgi:hypothetical protein